MSDVSMTDTNAMREQLTALIGKATQEDLTDDGRYFADSLSDLTRCRHGEIGEYENRHDGPLVEWLWNHRSAILALLATDRAAGVGEEALVYANCKGMIGDLPGGRDPEEFCDTCYRDALAASLPAPADASSLDPLLCRCENARRKGIPMLCVQCTGPVGSQTPPGAK